MRTVWILLLMTTVASAQKAGEVCREVVDSTRIYAVGCFSPGAIRYVCPKEGACVEDITTIPRSIPCGQVTKTVCGPPEMFISNEDLNRELSKIYGNSR